MRAYRADRAFDGERVLRDGALVLVDDGRIVAVEPASAAPPDGVPVTALPGTTLLPGLVDTHVHLCGDSGPRALDRLPELTPAEVDATVAEALGAGGGAWMPPQDHGFMYGASFTDPDGHVWEVMWMDPAHVQ